MLVAPQDNTIDYNDNTYEKRVVLSSEKNR